MEVHKHYEQGAASTRRFCTLDITVPKNCLYSLVEAGRTDMVHQRQGWEEEVELVPETIQGEKNSRLCEQCLVLEK